MKIVRLWEVDIRFGASLAGFGQFIMGSGGCTIQHVRSPFERRNK